MIKHLLKITTLFIIAFLAVKCMPKEESIWPEVKKESKPWVRWWWMGSAVDEKNLGDILEGFANKSIGGVEIAPIYGAKGYEDEYISYLSPRWMEVLEYTTKKADSLGLGVDMTNGTGWPFGGPQVSVKEAATLFKIQKYHLNTGEKLTDPIIINDPKQIKVGAYLQTLTAYGPNGEVEVITSKVDDNGILNWTPNSDVWTLYALFNGKTRQKVKRAAHGAKGYTFDHLSQDALNVYLARFDSAFAGKNINIRCFFNDSYEVFKASWSEKFFDEFKKRRKYDLREFVRELNGEGDSVIIARVKSDYRETMSDMVLHNFTENWTEWAHLKKAMTKNQSHGSPSNLLDLYGTVDIPEIETFGSSEFSIPGFRRDSADVKYSDTDPLFQKFASSGAHVSGKNLVSCETFTWLREHFKGAMSHCKPEVDQVFLSGVNHVFYHGSTYSPEEAGWPGWLFYASVNFARSNSFWDHIQGMNQYITRCQSVLQAGTHANDVLVYWPIYDIWDDVNGTLKEFKVHNTHDWLHMNQLRDMMQAGYSFDFISDRQIDKTLVNGTGLSTYSNGRPYEVMIIPECDVMPISTLKNILNLAKAGGRVLVESWPSDVPGNFKHDERQNELKKLVDRLEFENINGVSICNYGEGVIVLSEDLKKGLNYLQVKRETLTDTGLKFIRRTTNNGDYYFVANLTGETIDSDIQFNAKGNKALIMDPMSGNFGVAISKDTNQGTDVRLKVKSGESYIVFLTNEFKDLNKKWQYNTLQKAKEIEPVGNWTLSFRKGGPVLPASVEMKTPVYWTDLDNEEMNQFSGTGRYECVFTIDNTPADDYILRLENLRESAKVIINGREAGIIWGLPFDLKVGEYLKQGDNTIAIEVANLMANRIRYKDQKGEVWRNYHEINFVNIGYKSFDASNWEVQSSGIEGPVLLIPCSFN